ncbi:ion transporter [Halodesulfovibrio sp.]|uniref:CASTOR/POLLUX-related putative ion channel n=1 Tax=Halodesulfovibrio sp. TaxID=1912772 RepID=UPI0025C43535|nr:ion transporter [Halodesulfovibrio sp.]
MAVVDNTTAYDAFLTGLTIIFWIELSLRIFTFHSLKKYFQTFWLDILAVFPWAAALPFFQTLPYGNEFLIALRLVRILRIRSVIALWKTTLHHRLQYLLKKQIEQSLFRQFSLLLCLIVMLTICFGLLFQSIGFTSDGTSVFYMAFMSLLDPGTSFEVAHSNLITQIAFNTLVLIGIVIFNGIVIGLVVSKVEEYLSKVKQGYGDVVEQDHTLILGWTPLSEQLLFEINNFAEYETCKKNTVVIVSEHIKNVTDHLHKHSYKYIDAIKRKGKIFSTETLNLVDLQQAKHVIICDEVNGDKLPIEYSGASVIKSCLAAQYCLQNESTAPPCYFEHNFAHSKLITTNKSMSNFVPFNSNKYSALLLTSMLFHKAYYDVVSELFDFADDEFHFIPATETALIGKTFEEVLYSLPACVPVGISSANGLNTSVPSDYIIRNNDQLLCIAESSEALNMAIHQLAPSIPDKLNITRDIQTKNNSLKKLKQKIVIVGVNSRLPKLLDELALWNTDITIITSKEGRELANKYLELFGTSHTSYEFAIQNLSDASFTECYGTIILTDEAYIKQHPSCSPDTDTLFKLLQVLSTVPNNHTILEVQDAEQEELFSTIKEANYIVSTKLLAKILNISLVYPEMLSFFEELMSLSGTTIDFVTVNSLQLPDKQKLRLRSIHRTLYTRHGWNVIGVNRKDTPILINPFRIQQLSDPRYSTFQACDNDIILLPDDELIFLCSH